MPTTLADDSRNGSPQRDSRRPNARSRSNTARSNGERYSVYEEAPPMPEPEVRPSIRSQSRILPSRVETSREARIHDEYSQSPSRPNIGRSATFQSPTAIHRGPLITSRQDSVPADVGALRSQLRQTSRINTNGPDLFSDPSDGSTINSASPDRSYGARSVSPATSHDSSGSRSALNKRVPPPPPPSRSKKPPPPLPMKRAPGSANSVDRY